MYKFIKEPNDNNEYDIVKVNHEFEDFGITLSEMLENFENFLKGCGFYFEGKFLDFVDKQSIIDDYQSDEIEIKIEDTNVSFKLKKDQFIKIVDMANKNDMSLSQFINKTLSDYINKIEEEEEKDA